jgi:hypothetical protein
MAGDSSPPEGDSGTQDAAFGGECTARQVTLVRQARGVERQVR